MFAYNLVILRLAGADGVTAFTIVGYAAYLFNMVVVGFGQGSSPPISFCVGANRLALAGRLQRVTARLATGAGAALFCLTWAFAVPCGRLFVRSGPVLELIGQGAGLFALSFLLSGFNALTSFYFTAAGRAAESAAISLARGLVVLHPVAAAALGHDGGLAGRPGHRGADPAAEPWLPAPGGRAQGQGVSARAAFAPPGAPSPPAGAAAPPKNFCK